MDLNKQIGPLPIKYWIVVIIGGVGIGYLATRKSGSSGSSIPMNNASDMSAINALKDKLTTISLQEESLNKILGGQSTSIQALSDMQSSQSTNFMSNFDKLFAKITDLEKKINSGTKTTSKPKDQTGPAIHAGPNSDINAALIASGYGGKSTVTYIV